MGRPIVALPKLSAVSPAMQPRHKPISEYDVRGFGRPRLDRARVGAGDVLLHDVEIDRGIDARFLNAGDYLVRRLREFALGVGVSEIEHVAVGCTAGFVASLVATGDGLLAGGDRLGEGLGDRAAALELEGVVDTRVEGLARRCVGGYEQQCGGGRRTKLVESDHSFLLPRGGTS